MPFIHRTGGSFVYSLLKIASVAQKAQIAPGFYGCLLSL